MSQQEATTIKMMYHGKLELVTCPLHAKYEDFLEIIFERFAIPDEFKDYLIIDDDSTLSFKKETFLYITRLFPQPERIFYVRVDYRPLLVYLHSNNNRDLFLKLHKPKKSHDEDEMYEAIHAMQNCFTVLLPGCDDLYLETSQWKKPKAAEKLTKAPTRKSIRF